MNRFGEVLIIVSWEWMTLAYNRERKMHGTTLSQREIELIELASRGLTDAAIAANLAISEATVGTYWARIRAKLNASSRTEAVADYLKEQQDEHLQKCNSLLRELRVELQHVRQGSDEGTLLLHEVFEALPRPALVFDDQHRVRLANRAAAILLRRTESALPGTEVGELVPERLRQAHKQHETDFLKDPTTREMSGHLGIPILMPNGEESTVVADLIPFAHEGDTWTLCVLSPIV